MRKIFSLFYFLLVISPFAFAQEDDALYTPYDPVGIPTGAPAWMQTLGDVEHINYYAMVDSFERFQQTHPKYRIKTPETKAVINHFRRWQRAYYPYVQRDGSIKMPKHSDFRKFVAQMNAESAQQQARRKSKSGSQWELLTPLMTYHHSKKTPYPGQSNIQRFDISQSNPDVLYAGTETGMMFKTVDKGQHWTSCTPDFFFGGLITSVEISRPNPDKVVIGAGAFLWLTEDGGQSWKDITPSQVRNGGKTVRDAIFHPTDDNTLLVANRKGLYKSTNNGQTWTLLYDGECFDVKYKYDAGTPNPNCLYALVRTTTSTNSAAVLKYSSDGGQSWELRSPALTDYHMTCGRIGLSAAPTGGDYVYVVSCKSDQPSYANRDPQFFGTPVFFKSADAGQTWTIYNDIVERMAPSEGSWAMGQGYYDMLCIASPKDPEDVYFGLLNLYRSKDGGQTLQTIGGYYGTFDIHCDLQDMHIVGDDVWVSSDGGLIYSNDGFTAHSEARINGIYASEFFGYGQGWNEDVIVGGRNHNGDMATMASYNGACLHLGGSEDPTGYVMLSDPHKVAFSDITPKNLILPDDWKATLGQFPDFWSMPYESQFYGVGMEFDPRYAKSFLIYRGYYDERRDLWKTVDEGKSFVKLHTFPQQINSQAISRSNPDKIVVCTRGGLYSTTDGGTTWVLMPNQPEVVKNAYMGIVQIHPTDENEIWVSVDMGTADIYRTRDNGQTWEHLSDGLTIDPAYTNLYESATEKVIITRFFLTGNEKNAAYAVGYVYRPQGFSDFTVMRGRVFYRDESTNGWQDYSEGLPQVITLTRMLPFYKDGKVRVATNNGIWQRDLMDVDFQPIAQPMVLSGGKATELGAQIQLDSYSIVNQQDATWQWEFLPEPLSVSDPTARNPVITVDPELTYNVTLTVTTPAGTDTKTVKNMIIGTRGILDPEEGTTSIAGHEVLAHDMLLTQPDGSGADLHFTPHGLTAPCQLQLFGVDGQVKRTAVLSAERTTAVAVGGLPAGSYFYLIKGGDFKKTGKVLVK